MKRCCNQASLAAETGLSQQQVMEVVQKTLDYITESLVAGENIEFRDFGVFEVITRKFRKGTRNLYA